MSADKKPVVEVNSFENRYKLASQSRRGLLKSDVGVRPLESRKPFRESMENLDRANIGCKKENNGKVLNEITFNNRNCDDWNSKQLVESVLIHESYESKHNGVCKTMTCT
jgi:succinate dehydrogenase flavin-adding protein (antitoxin of CptAB toxin-antitoxin module)